MTRIIAVLAACALLVLAGCDQDSSAGDTIMEWVADTPDSTPDTTADVPAEIPADSPTDTTPDSSECTCDATDGCIVVTITRQTDDSMQPWVVWPTEADGTGTLIVSAISGSTTLARETVADASYVSGDASYTVELCVTPGAVEVRAFLDDDLDAASDATYSADYLDSCMGENDGCFRCVNTTVAAAETVTVGADLVGSCD